MRATFITTALENGAQLEDVQKAAGHRDPVGLTPKKYQSGETDVAGRISKIGDGSVRTALYEAAALDGFKVEAALWQPENKPPSDTTMIVQVHGSGGNLASFPLRATARVLSAKGYAALSISTRQHDEHVNTDNFFDVRRDIGAAVATVKALGFKSIVLCGHSLGTVQVAFYAATDWDPAIKAVILTGAFGKLPWKSRHILIQDEGNYKALDLVAFPCNGLSTQQRRNDVVEAAILKPYNFSLLRHAASPITCSALKKPRHPALGEPGWACLVRRGRAFLSKIRT